MVALSEQFHHPGARPGLQGAGYGLQRSGESGESEKSVDSYNHQGSMITDQKRRTSNDLFIDHYSLVIERSAGANEIVSCGYPDNTRVSTDIGTGLSDPEAELYYARNRTYNLVLGRWIQRDPIRYKDAENLYEYAASHPTTDRDPSGEELAEVVSGGGTFSVEMQEDPFYKWQTDNQIVFHPSKKATECCREIMFVQYVEARYRTVFGGPTTRGWHVDDGGTGRYYGGVWPYYAQQFPWKTGGKWGASAWDTPYPDGSTVQVESWRDYAVCTDPVKGRKPVSYGYVSYYISYYHSNPLIVRVIVGGAMSANPPGANVTVQSGGITPSPGAVEVSYLW